MIQTVMITQYFALCLLCSRLLQTRYPVVILVFLATHTA